jgi:hypothetical protein
LFFGASVGIGFFVVIFYSAFGLIYYYTQRFTQPPSGKPFNQRKPTKRINSNENRQCLSRSAVVFCSAFFAVLFIGAKDLSWSVPDLFSSDLRSYLIYLRIIVHK